MEAYGEDFWKNVENGKDIREKMKDKFGGKDNCNRPIIWEIKNKLIRIRYTADTKTGDDPTDKDYQFDISIELGKQTNPSFTLKTKENNTLIKIDKSSLAGEEADFKEYKLLEVLFEKFIEEIGKWLEMSPIKKPTWEMTLDDYRKFFIEWKPYRDYCAAVFNALGDSEIGKEIKKEIKSNSEVQKQAMHFAMLFLLKGPSEKDIAAVKYLELTSQKKYTSWNASAGRFYNKESEEDKKSKGKKSSRDASAEDKAEFKKLWNSDKPKITDAIKWLEAGKFEKITPDLVKVVTKMIKILLGIEEIKGISLDKYLNNENGAVIDENNDKDGGTGMNKDYGLNMILYGPPGTGKTYKTAIYAVAICNGESIDDLTDYDDVMARYNKLKKDGRVVFTTFHQSYGYEEFIEGIKPVISQDDKNEDDKNKDLKYKIEPGIFKKFCEENKEIEENNNCVFIIDEINRGNISKIFGELITLIEDKKRAGTSESASAVLPYSGKEFSVSKNVYILGTMNTADRSIALMDTALRRRFQFVEMMPNLELLKKIVISDKGKKLNIGEMLEAINKRIDVLYDREHRIGHAFFMDLEEEQKRSIDKLASIFEKSVIPLLQEYFYEDYGKIQMVLGDNDVKVKDEYKFITRKKNEVQKLFKGDDNDLDLPDYKYEIVPDNFKNIDTYRKIYTDLETESKQPEAKQNDE